MSCLRASKWYASETWIDTALGMGAMKPERSLPCARGTKSRRECECTASLRRFDCSRLGRFDFNEVAPAVASGVGFRPKVPVTVIGGEVSRRRSLWLATRASPMGPGRWKFNTRSTIRPCASGPKSARPGVCYMRLQQSDQRSMIRLALPQRSRYVFKNLSGGRGIRGGTTGTVRVESHGRRRSPKYGTGPTRLPPLSFVWTSF